MTPQRQRLVPFERLEMAAFEETSWARRALLARKHSIPEIWGELNRRLAFAGQPGVTMDSFRRFAAGVQIEEARGRAARILAPLDGLSRPEQDLAAETPGELAGEMVREGKLRLPGLRRRLARLMRGVRW